MKKTIVQYLRYGLFALPVILVAIQFVPYGRPEGNPPIIREPLWNSPESRALAKRACFDCHSNETVWPWYSRIAPVSWLVRWDVDNGRKELNFSEWKDGARKGESPHKIREELAEGEMPPLQYRLIHAEARLTPAERQQLADGLSATALQQAHR